MLEDDARRRACLRGAGPSDKRLVSEHRPLLPLLPTRAINSTHLHILDMDRTGPSYEAVKSRNLKMDFVIQAMEEEIKELHVDDASA